MSIYVNILLYNFKSNNKYIIIFLKSLICMKCLLIIYIYIYYRFINLLNLISPSIDNKILSLLISL